VVEVYFKDWQNNRYAPPTPAELEQLVEILRREGVGLVGVSLRASAYEACAAEVCTYVRERTGLPLVVGGWHATVRPERCLPFADALCIGEADRSFPAFVDAAFRGDRDGVLDAAGHWVRDGDGVRRNAPLPLVTDLDALPWRDYESADKWVIRDGVTLRGDPMAKDPLHQVLCSIGCIQKCNFCHNSFESEAPGPRLRFRSVSSVLDELAARRRANPDIRRVRFDDEIFGLDRKWLREFAERYPREVGLPFDILTEPTVVSDTYADLLRQAGARYVHMGVQSTESVNRDLLDRRAARETTRAAVERLTSRGMRIRYLTMVDIPGVTEAQKEDLFAFFLEVPAPYDLYLFSLTWFPGSKMVEDMLADGRLQPREVEGEARKTFSQYRVDLDHPRSPEDRWWIALLVLEASQLVPRRALAEVARRRWLRSHPGVVVRAAQLATFGKTARTAARMVAAGELTPTLVRRWWNPDGMITM
jgi:radical SAM superfamily enzyme YgiQ (UPF0313 family)